MKKRHPPVVRRSRPSRRSCAHAVKPSLRSRWACLRSGAWIAVGFAGGGGGGGSGGFPGSGGFGSGGFPGSGGLGSGGLGSGGAPGSGGAVGTGGAGTGGAYPLTRDASDLVDLGSTGIKISRLAMGSGTHGNNGASDQTRLGPAFPNMLVSSFDRGITFGRRGRSVRGACPGQDGDRASRA